MFTGIVEELGTVESVEDQGDAIRLTVRATTVLEGTGLGDSIAVNGCCLTVATRTDDTWTADVMQETLDKTSLHGVTPGDTVNLERAVTADKRLGGHIVQGHVDGVAHRRRGPHRPPHDAEGLRGVAAPHVPSCVRCPPGQRPDHLQLLRGRDRPDLLEARASQAGAHQQRLHPQPGTFGPRDEVPPPCRCPREVPAGGRRGGEDALGHVRNYQANWSRCLPRTAPGT